jgi:glucose/mannose-6-phosphate isomerase
LSGPEPDRPPPDPAVLDDPGGLAAADPGGMLDAVASAGDQARAARKRADTAPLVGPLPEVVVVAGMGGSGVAGDMLAALAFASSAVPVVPVKGDRLPTFVGPGTLLLAVSYSGNTAETLSAVEQGLAAGARLVAVAAGGALADLAERRGSPLVLVEGGRMPRAALWSLLVPVCSAAEAAGVLPPLGEQLLAAAEELDAQAHALGPAVPTGANPAKRAALRLRDRLPVVWGSGQLGAVAAARFRTQCNENAKVPVVSAALPEANHNDVMGLEGGLGPGRELVLLRDQAGEHERDGRRIAAVCEALGIGDPIVRLAGDGPALARLARLTAFTDFASAYLAVARGVDPTPIRTIERVKAVLAAGAGAAR